MSKPDYMKYDGRKEEPPYETEQPRPSISAARVKTIAQHHAALRDIMYYEPTRIAPIIYVRLRR